MTEDEIEIVSVPCLWCKTGVDLLWVKGGGCLSTLNYILVADWALHWSCSMIMDKCLNDEGFNA
jgi:hypothetical protein